jgi:hypothetical protein
MGKASFQVFPAYYEIVNQWGGENLLHPLAFYDGENEQMSLA